MGRRLAADGFTLSHRDEAVQRRWIDHSLASRRIAAAIGRELGNPAVTNLLIPDGFKELRPMPWGAVWDEFCRCHDCPPDGQWFNAVAEYEREVLAVRTT